MLNRRRFVMSAAAGVAAMSVASPLAAQTPMASPSAGSAEIEGLVHGYTRSYRTAKTADRISVGITVWESEDFAKAFVKENATWITNGTPKDKLTLKETDNGLTADVVWDNRGMHREIWVDGVFVVLVKGIGEDVAKATAMTEPFVAFVKGKELNDGDVSFDEQGGSTGGVFDAMPAKTDDVAKPYTIVKDSPMMDSET